MFNNKNKKEALQRMNDTNEELRQKTNHVIDRSGDLYSDRESLKDEIDIIWNKINEFRNKPTEIGLTLEQVKIEFNRYTKLIEIAEINNDTDNVDAKVATGAGIATGAGVAMLAPTAAMAIATTFGTASTGAAISSLTGVAATNAALAWLGGGTLAAGGAGIAGGEVLLGLAGPIGWSIAAAGLVTGGVLANSKNKKVAEQANEATEKLKGQIKINEGILTEIENIIKQTRKARTDIISMLGTIQTLNTDFSLLTDDEKLKLGTIVNDVLAFAKLLNKTVGDVQEK